MAITGSMIRAQSSHPSTMFARLPEPWHVTRHSPTHQGGDHNASNASRRFRSSNRRVRHQNRNIPKLHTYRVHSDASVQLHEDTFCKAASALKAATRIGRCYSNGAVIHVISADGDPIWSEVYRPPRALWQPIARAFLSYLQVGVFVATLIASGVYFGLYSDVYDEKTARLIEQLQTPIGFIVVAVSIMASVVTTVTMRVAIDHNKSWILRREVIARSVSLGCIAIFALPIVMVAVFVSDEIILTAMICLLSGLLAMFVFGFVRILTSVYCYASDVREVD